MKKIIVILSILLIMVAIYAIRVGAIREVINEKNLVLLAQENIKERESEETRISSLNFYGNISERRDINALIIGDSIAQSDGSSNVDKKWYNSIIKNTQKKYNLTMTTDLITGVSATGVRSWVELNKANPTKKYDIAFICLGQNDQFNITPEQFGVFYESIIIKLKKLNPKIEIIPIIESSFREYNNYSNTIIALSKHYNLQYADALQAFNSSGYQIEGLLKDVVNPNDKGYNYYVTTIEKVINSNYKFNKKTGIKYSTFYNNTNKLINFVFDNSPDLNNGFILDNGFTGIKVGSTLTFNTTHSVAIVDFLRQPNGGKFKVFIDANFVEEIDTNKTSQVGYSNLLSDNLEGKHKIRIEISSLAKSGTVKIFGLVTN